MRTHFPPAAPVPDRLAEHEADEIISELYQAHALELIRMAKLLLRDQASAEDVVQEAFLNLYRALHRLGDHDQMLPYLRTCVINGSRSVHRSRRRALLRRVQHEPPESVLVSRNTSWAALGNNGATLYSCSVVSNANGSVGSVTYYAQSLSGPPGQTLPAGQSSAGSARQVIASWNDLPYPQCWASLRPAGDYLLVQYPVAVKNGGDWVQPAVLNLATGQLRLIAAPAFYGPADVAW